MKQYLDLLQDIMDNGVDKMDRTGVGTRSVFGRQMRFDLNDGFPLLTTKKVHLKSIIYELLWFIKGDTNVKYLQDNGVRIWNNFSFPLIFLQSRSNYTIPLGLQDFYGEFSVNVPGILSAIFIATLPIMIIYFLLQDSIEAGLTGGAVKE